MERLHSDVAYLSATELLRRLDAGATTSAQIVEALLQRIAEIDSAGTSVALRSILAIAPDARAIAEACDAERAQGILRGPLHGLPVVVKDNIEVMGLPSAAGSLALVDAPVAADADVVQTLKHAGAIVMASTNCSEWANMRSGASTSGWSALGGLTANPWALDRSAGGSSSGSGAALAAGLSPLALGTETDGSIVCPSAVNGVVGLKPTVGRLSVTGIVPISHSQDTPGPMGRSVGDVALMWRVLSSDSPSTRLAKDLRIGVVPQWSSGRTHTDDLFGEVVEHLRRQTVFAAIDTCEVPEMTAAHHQDEYTVLLAELHDDMAHYLQQRRPNARVKTLRDIVAFNREHADLELQHFGQEHFELALERGGASADSQAALARNQAWAREQCLDPALSSFDVLIAPTYAPAWKHDFVLGHPSIGGAVTSPAAVAGYPLLSLPIGLVHGLPVGMTIVGAPHSEAVILEAAAAIEDALALNANNDWRPSFTMPSRG